MKIIVWLVVTTTLGTVLKGHRIRKIENHWPRLLEFSALPDWTLCGLHFLLHLAGLGEAVGKLWGLVGRREVRRWGRGNGRN